MERGVLRRTSRRYFIDMGSCICCTFRRSSIDKESKGFKKNSKVFYRIRIIANSLMDRGPSKGILYIEVL